MLEYRVVVLAIRMTTVYAIDSRPPNTMDSATPQWDGPTSHVASATTFLVVHVGVCSQPVLWYNAMSIRAVTIECTATSIATCTAASP